MSAALLMLWCPAAAPPAGEEFDRVVAAFPGRIRALPMVEVRQGNLRLAVWSRGAGFPEGLRQTGGSGVLGIVGNPTRSDLAGAEPEAGLDQLLGEIAREGAAAFDTLSPPFAAVHRSERDGTVEVVVDRCGLQHLYFRRSTAGGLWVSSSSLALARALPSSVDPDAVAEWLAAGHFMSDRTLFREIRKLSGGTRLVLGADGIREQHRSKSAIGLSETRAEDFADRFLASVAACASHPGVAAELTGGLDSRLVLAGLLRHGSPFFAWTFGQPGNAELRTIDRLRRQVQFEHLAVGFDADFDARVATFVADMHELCDGEVNAVEYAPLIAAFDALEGLRSVSVSGGGGEIGRGFYYGALAANGASLRGIDLDRLTTKVMRPGGRARLLLRPDVVSSPDAPLRRVLEELICQSPASAPDRILDDLYIRGRMQRFGGRNFTTTGVFCRQALPYFGNDLVETTVALPQSLKIGGAALRDTLTALAPALASVSLDSGETIVPSSAAEDFIRARIAFGRKVLRKVAERSGRRVPFAPVEAVPWRAVWQSKGFRQLVEDLLLASDARTHELLDRGAVSALAGRALHGHGMREVGMVLTLELSLRRAETR